MKEEQKGNGEDAKPPTVVVLAQLLIHPENGQLALQVADGIEDKVQFCLAGIGLLSRAAMGFRAEEPTQARTAAPKILRPSLVMPRAPRKMQD